MSTRSVIARAVGSNGTRGFSGRYHHWDGYPSGVGAMLWELYHGHFKKDIGKMAKVLIDEHPAGWSTIMGDWSMAPGYVERDKGPCAVCGEPNETHYRQYFKNPSVEDQAEMARGNYVAKDHGYREIDKPKPPQCHCHGDSHGKAEAELTDKDAQSCGCEYAYVFDEGPTLVIYSSYSGDGSKMIGMFGMGDEKASWREVVRLDLNAEEEPDWKKIDALAR